MSAFTAGNIVVYRVGGTSSAATAVFLDEYTPQGTYVQSIALPTTTTGSQDALTDSGAAGTAGEITETANGTSILVAGYDVAPGTTGVTTSTAPRVIGIVSANGTVDTSNANTTYSGTNFRSAASADGQNIYVGTGTGVGYVAAGSTNAPVSLTTVAANQVLTSNGQLYYSTSSGTAGIYALGTGLPTTTGQTSTLIAASTKPYAFAFTSLGGGTTPDTLYVADGTNGVEKFSVSGSPPYAMTGKVAVSGVEGLTVSVSNGVATLYVTTGSTIQTIVDTSGAGGTLSATPTTIVTAGANSAPAGTFKGDALAPTVVCFCSGTLIRTADGDVAVENLRVGDLVVTASGARRPIRWLGHRETDCAHHPEPRKVWPVRVRAGALGAGLPYTDLWISPGHALCLDDVLYPVRALVHGQAITQVERATVTYWHVELDSHDLLIANGAASESYLDTGNRLGFDNAPGAIDLYPDFEPLSTDGFCRPYVESGALLAAARYRLFGNRKTAARPAVHLVADDSVLEPVRRDNTITFVVPAGTRELRLISPQKAADGDDVRMIGVLISAITIDTGSERRDIALDHQGLFAGFHEIERSEAGTWRWTNGAAHFAKNLWADASGAFLLHLTGMFEHPAEVESMQIAA